MAKQTHITLLFIALHLALTVTSASAREFRSVKQKSAKATKTAAQTQEAPAIKTVEVGRVETPARTSQAKQSPTAIAHSRAYPAAPSSTQKGVYNSLLIDQTNLSEQIGILSSQLQGVSAGKAKKISNQINDLTAKLAAVERQMDAFPESIKNPNYQPVVEVDEVFAKKMDALASQMNAATDPYAGTISSDPELEALYRQHLSENGYSTHSGGSISGASRSISGSDALTYRVMIAISKSALPKSAFTGLSDILEQRTSNGGVIYYQGSYQSKSEADRACTSILAAHKFRDAFVVAMEGDRRVPLK